MTWGMVAVGVGTVAAGAMSANAAGRAADVQAGAASNAMRPSVAQDAQNRLDNAQFLKTGTAANKRLAQLLGIKPAAPTWEDAAAEHLNQHKIHFGVGYTQDSDMAAAKSQTQDIFDRMQRDYQAEQAQSGDATPQDIMEMDPGYQFRLQQGLDATKGNAVAHGGFDSGATLKALTRFGQDYASNEFGNVYNRLAGASGTGQTAQAGNTGSGMNMAGQTADLTTQAGNARAAGVVGGANAWGNVASSGASQYNNYQNNEILKKLLAGGSSGRPSTYNAPSGSALSGFE